ncbi:MAG TPA: hypothetical protein VMB24_01865 [Dehalococcoidales bacterium]|nr:hypothetical protein [Dehalococcoidales bacterium]
MDWVGNAIPYGDGTSALTVVNYENYSADSQFQIKWLGHGQYRATIQDIDPATSTTLLKLEDANIPPASIGDSDAVKVNSKITIHSWGFLQSDKLIQAKETTTFYNYGTILFLRGSPYMEPGAPATDAHGQIIGLIGTFYDAFTIRPGAPGMTPPLINIKKSIANLNNINEYSWRYKPVEFYEISKPAKYLNAISAEDKNDIAEAIQPLLKTMGPPLPANEIPPDYVSFLMNAQTSQDGSFLCLTYINPIKLYDVADQIVAEVKWISLQWGRNGNNPNRIFYGTIQRNRAVATGGFLITGDTGTFEKVINRINLAPR